MAISVVYLPWSRRGGGYYVWLYLWFTYPGLGGVYSVWLYLLFTYPGLGGGLLCVAISVVYLPWSRWGFTLIGYICGLPSLV